MGVAKQVYDSRLVQASLLDELLIGTARDGPVAISNVAKTRRSAPPHRVHIIPFPSRNQTYNERTNWGITEKHLEHLPYRTLESIFYGMHNITLPNNLLTTLEPNEILRIYAGVGTVKGTHGDLRANAPTTFYPLLAYLHNKGADTFGAKDIVRKRFASKEQQFERLPSYEKDNVVNSFAGTRRISNRENSHFHNFYDPNCDGTSKQAYVVAILRSVAQMYHL